MLLPRIIQTSFEYKEFVILCAGRRRWHGKRPVSSVKHDLKRNGTVENNIKKKERRRKQSERRSWSNPFTAEKQGHAHVWCMCARMEQLDLWIREKNTHACWMARVKLQVESTGLTDHLSEIPQLHPNITHVEAATFVNCNCSTQ